MDATLDAIGLSHQRAAQGVLQAAANLVQDEDPEQAAEWRTEAQGRVSDRSLKGAVRRCPQLGE